MKSNKSLSQTKTFGRRTHAFIAFTAHGLINLGKFLQQITDKYFLSNDIK